ncbi:hypothetical protein EYF80_043987 [Liparis tanakae]|uniref:Uncharacterized protein n=1 Tax=Liparis tanakae TaxID=230148 RepID=A0A4Z2FX45_9TELE|nr:hypothetical protein EYF80_043987 [Liparis tanakae]
MDHRGLGRGIPATHYAAALLRLRPLSLLLYASDDSRFLHVYVLLASSCARYLVKPLSRTLSPSRCRNSSSAGPADSLLYISSSPLWPAMQYITPTFRWKLNYGENADCCN